MIQEERRGRNDLVDVLHKLVHDVLLDARERDVGGRRLGLLLARYEEQFLEKARLQQHRLHANRTFKKKETCFCYLLTNRRNGTLRYYNLNTQNTGIYSLKVRKS